jgi:bifunctional non-homologous end joining protein LigD
MQMLKFVIQEHHARSHHYDFRLEKDSVYKSWALPKGMPEVAGVRHLAVQVEDHALTFGTFEGLIPKGQYGAGKIEIWDAGTYEASEWSETRIAFVLFGARVQGQFLLVRFSDPSTSKWLLMKHEHEAKSASNREA